MKKIFHLPQYIWSDTNINRQQIDFCKRQMTYDISQINNNLIFIAGTFSFFYSNRFQPKIPYSHAWNPIFLPANLGFSSLFRQTFALWSRSPPNWFWKDFAEFVLSFGWSGFEPSTILANLLFDSLVIWLFLWFFLLEN